LLLGKRIKELKEKENQSFVLRIKNNITLKMLDNGNCKVGKDEGETERASGNILCYRKKNRV